MMTQTHLLLGSAVFSRSGKVAVTAAAFVGSLLPDFPMYPFVLLSLIMDWPGQLTWGSYYWSDWLQQPMGLVNSVPLYAVILVWGIARKNSVLIAFSGAALLHCGTDFALHHDDGHMHLWPFSQWRFQSPVSYWDPNHYARYWQPLEAGLALGSCWVLANRHRRLWVWIVLGLAAALSVAALVAGMMFQPDFA